MKSTYHSPRRRFFVAVCSVALGLTAAFASVSPAAAQCSCHPWADVVVESTSTIGDANRLLDAPDQASVDFENDGNDPGFVTVGFDGDVIVDGVGDDFAIHVVDFLSTEIVEAFELLVSDDGSSWVSLGIVSSTLSSSDPQRLTFDLQPFGVSTVTQIRIVNTTVDTLRTNEGVDLDAFEALNCNSPSDPNLEQCEDTFDDCSTELTTCDGELDDCSAELSDRDSVLDGCEDALDQSQLDLEQCGETLGTAHADLAEVAAGLTEVQRLLRLPRGRRQSDFSCSGQACQELTTVIRMLLDPPGKSIRRGKRQK